MEEAEGSSKDEILPGYKTIDEFSKNSLTRVSQAIKAFQGLPKPGPDWDLQKSYPEFNKALRSYRIKSVNLISKILNSSKIPPTDFKRKETDDQFDFMVQANDDILERIGISLDEADGYNLISKRTETLAVGSGIVMNKGLSNKNSKRKREEDKSKLASKEPASVILAPQNRPKMKAIYKLKATEKPQLRFPVPVDNSNSPFVPKLKDKPNSIKPFSILPEYNSKNEEFFGHPYQIEITQWKPLDYMLKKVKPEFPRKISETPLNFIHSPAALEKLKEDLRDQTEIAVDLEHHSHRTFLGLTCIMQISTREKDYIIDGFSLREILFSLNEIFTNPKIVKVLHGAASDIEWLQRDFGLYMVGLFDTYHAGKILGFPQLSLQYLLGVLCREKVDKTYQLADWRIRPLPNEMIEYARRDTHFLLYIYDVLKNRLIDSGNELNNLLFSCYEESRAVCLKRYEKPISNPQLTLRKTKRALNNRQLYAFTEIYYWRDQLAREKDESLGFILPNHMLLTISETLPKEMSGILACCEPIPFFLQTHVGEIHRIVQKARELQLHDENKSSEVIRSEKRNKLKNWIVILNSVHDVSPDELEMESNKTKRNKNFKSTDHDDDDIEKDSILPNPQFDLSWPKPWTNPPGFNLLKVKSQSTFLFSSSVKRTNTPKLPKDAEKGGKEKISAYMRYKLSHDVIESIKDPQKKSQLDMEDPIVKTVIETIYIPPETNNTPQMGNNNKANSSTTNSANSTSSTSDQVKNANPLYNPLAFSINANSGRKSIIDIEDGEINEINEEFIPFNPMAGAGKGGKGNSNNRNKRKGEKRKGGQNSQERDEQEKDESERGHKQQRKESSVSNPFNANFNHNDGNDLANKRESKKDKRKNKRKSKWEFPNSAQNQQQQQQEGKKGKKNNWEFRNPVPDVKFKPEPGQSNQRGQKFKNEPNSSSNSNSNSSSRNQQVPNPKFKGGSGNKIFSKFKASSGKSITFK